MRADIKQIEEGEATDLFTICDKKYRKNLAKNSGWVDDKGNIGAKEMENFKMNQESIQENKELSVKMQHGGISSVKFSHAITTDANGNLTSSSHVRNADGTTNQAIGQTTNLNSVNTAKTKAIETTAKAIESAEDEAGVEVDEMSVSQVVGGLGAGSIATYGLNAKTAGKVSVGKDNKGNKVYSGAKDGVLGGKSGEYFVKEDGKYYKANKDGSKIMKDVPIVDKDKNPILDENGKPTFTQEPQKVAKSDINFRGGITTAWENFGDGLRSGLNNLSDGLGFTSSDNIANPSNNTSSTSNHKPNNNNPNPVDNSFSNHVNSSSNNIPNSSTSHNGSQGKIGTIGKAGGIAGLAATALHIGQTDGFQAAFSHFANEAKESFQQFKQESKSVGVFSAGMNQVMDAVSGEQNRVAARQHEANGNTFGGIATLTGGFVDITPPIK